MPSGGQREKYTERKLASCPRSSFRCLRGLQLAAIPQLEAHPQPHRKRPHRVQLPPLPRERSERRLGSGGGVGPVLGCSWVNLDPSINSQACASWPLSPVSLRLSSAPFLPTLNLTFHAGKQLAEEGGRGGGRLQIKLCFNGFPMKTSYLRFHSGLGLKLVQT